jgi:hypothetical protein
MSLWTLIKLFAALCVMAVMAFTGAFVYHILVKPLGGVFERIVPNPAEVIGRQPDAEFAKMLDSAELPDIDPGEKTFQKAHELLALGKLDEAREKLTTIINIYPSSSTAPVARRILGDMNLDEILSSSSMDGKAVVTVKRGNSFLGIAGQNSTTLDMMMYLNNMMELGNLQPGDELTVMPLDFRILIEPERMTLSLWDGGRFIRDYPIIHLGVTGKLAKGKTTISSKVARLDGKRVLPQSKAYRAADKAVQITKPALVISGAPEDSKEFQHGIILRPEDMEEVSLLTRVGNEVEIR